MQSSWIQITTVVLWAGCQTEPDPSDAERTGFQSTATGECAMPEAPAVVEGTYGYAQAQCAAVLVEASSRLAAVTGAEEVSLRLEAIDSARGVVTERAAIGRQPAYVGHEGLALMLASGSGVEGDGGVRCDQGLPWFSGGEGATDVCHLRSDYATLNEGALAQLEACQTDASGEDASWAAPLQEARPPGHLLVWVSEGDVALLHELGHGPDLDAPLCAAGMPMYTNAFEAYGQHGEESLFAIGLSGRGLSGAHFEGADLSVADLTHTDLSYAYLSDAAAVGANFMGADLTNALLSGADLSGSNWADVNASGADLEGADLSQVDLSGADLSGVHLAGVTSGGVVGTPAEVPAPWQLVGGYLLGPRANLPGTDLSGMDLTGVDLTGANLSGADLSGVDLTEVDLSGADLTEVDLSGADLSRALLGGADLTGSRLTGADLSGVDLSTAELADVSSGDLVAGPEVLPELWRYTSGFLIGPRADLSGVDLTGANLNEVDVSGADLSGADLTGAAMVEANLYEANLEGARFDNVLLSWAYMSSVRASGAGFNGAEMSHVDLTYADLTEADLTGVVLSFSVLSYADLTRADLSLTELFAVFFTGADLTDANLTFADGVNATYWDGTICPDGTNSDDNLGTCCGHLNDVMLLTEC